MAWIELEGTLHSRWQYVSAALSGWEWDEPLQATLSFPNKLSSWKGLGETLSLGYEFIPLVVCGMGMLLGLTLGAISTAYPCIHV